LVKEGRGYKMAEGTKKDNREIGYIEIDSIFSPVIVVSIDVESTRVGKMTNWDKLILTVKTDGTISAEEAFNEAVKILVEQYSSFLTLDSGVEEGPISGEAEVVTAETEESEPVEEEVTEKKEKKEKKAKKAKK